MHVYTAYTCVYTCYTAVYWPKRVYTHTANGPAGKGELGTQGRGPGPLGKGEAREAPHP